jgi:HlyD family secretion protein
MKKLAVFLCLGLAALAAGWYGKGDEARVAYRTVAAATDNLVVTTSATGTLEPEEVVDVGAQVMGQIKHFGASAEDRQTIDYGTHVEKGTILARIDDTLYKSQVAQAESALLKAQADLEQLKARHRQYSRDWERARHLLPTGGVSRTEYDGAQASFESARASLATGEAAIAQAKEALNQAQINLDYTVIRSPVKGVIIDRRVNVGQTVVAALNAPSLFLIAKDLKRMCIWASVNEADIGRIVPGVTVTFTVDAYPDETFRGVVSQRRLNATMIQSVVTYTVVIDVDNPDERLLPYLTANVRFVLARRDKALLVPNLALQWHPEVRQVHPAARQAASGVPDGLESVADQEKGRHLGVVWVPEGPHVRPVHVVTGLSDGSRTQVVAGDLRPGDAVVVGMEQEGNEGTTNPFLPKLLGKKR